MILRALRIWGRRWYSVQSPKPRPDPLHLPDSFMGLKDQPVEIDKEVFQQYHCYPTIADVKFIKNMTVALKGGTITWWEAAGILKRFDVKLKTFHVCEILKKNIDSDASMGLFRWAEAQPGYKHDTVTYNAMLRVLGYNQRFRQLQSLFREMKSRQIQPTYATFMAVVQSYFDASMPEKALQTFNEFESYVKPKPKKKYYHHVIKKLIELNRTDLIPNIVRGMLKVGHVTETETLNGVIKGLCQSGRVGMAFDLSREMVNKGCVTDTHTYIHLLGGLVKSTKEMERASDIISDMSKYGCFPNERNFNLLLDFLLSSEKASEALNKVVKPMLITKCGELHTESNRLLINFLERTGDADLACEFYKGLAIHGILPDTRSYNTLLRLLNAAEQHVKALELDKEMSKHIVPDVETKNILIQIMCKQGDTEQTMKVFKEFKRLKLKPNKVTFDVLLVGLAINDKVLECLEVMKKMERSGYSPEQATYACVIEAFSIGGLHDQAVKLYKRMKLEGLSLDEDLQNAMLLRRRRCLESLRNL